MTLRLWLCGQEEAPRICVVLDSVDGKRQLDADCLPAIARLNLVCAAELHDDLLHKVRMWTRLGYTSEQIQEELDARYESILTIAKTALPMAGHR